MTRRRFYALPISFSDDRGSVQLAADEARHLRDVLRLQAGDEVYVFDGAGREFQGAVAESGRDSVRLDKLVEVAAAHPESPLDLTLAIALLKGEKFDLVTQKATELGANRIVPIITERADVRLRDVNDASKRVARWQRIALEAAKQSGRARVPAVEAPVTFATFIAQAEAALRVMFSERDGESLQVVASQRAEFGPVIAMVGSEGGWSDDEIDNAKNAGWKIITLGGRMLRAETAAIVVVALLQNLLGDLK